MKSAISPDIWETKRMLITKLYKDEEWPLKQVIKLVQTRDFHPRYVFFMSSVTSNPNRNSESQLRSRLKKWHITKPSRKKYDGSRRLSGAKKNSMQKRPTDIHHHPTLPSSSTYNTLQSHPRPLPSHKTDESDSFSEGRSEVSRPSVSIPEMSTSTSPANHYILPSSPEEAQLASPIYGPNPIMGPSTPITPAVYGVDDSKRAPDDTNHTIYYFPQESSPPVFPASSVPVPYPQNAAFGSFSDPLAMLDQPGDYMGYPNVHYIPSSHPFPHQHKDPNPVEASFAMSELPPPLVDGSWVSHYGQPPHSQSRYFQEDCMQPAIYQAL